jgi:predicted RNA-binding Zn-ribbon protein involved in translation (DUF1610 family)
MTFTMTEEEFRQGDDEFAGRCLACGAEAFGVEPDARRYECEECGENMVYGLAELLIIGRIEFSEEHDSGSG